MSPLLGLMVLLQGLQVSAEVDRDRVALGDAVSYTVRVVLPDGGAPVQASLPGFGGFLLVGRSEQREDGPGGPGTSYRLELRLRAQRLGRWLIGPVRIEQRGETIASPQLEVEVYAPPPGRNAVPLSARVMAMINRAPPPPRGDVGLSLLASADSILAGQQLDLVTAAWFPRDLLARLRRPPEIQPPTVDGVYSAVQPSAAGVGASRQIDGVWYDLYVAHQVVFPITPGLLEVPEATLAFTAPGSRFLIGEDRSYRLTSRPLQILITAPPVTASTSGGPVASGLTLEYQLQPDTARAGEPIAVDMVLRGTGNVALWPDPQLSWPEGVRGYPDRAEEEMEERGGLLGGMKRFSFSVLADSAGSLALPTVRYPFYDLAARDWSEAVAGAVVLPVLPARPFSERRALLQLLGTDPVGTGSGRGALWFAIWLLAALPPLAWLTARLIAVLRSGTRSAASSSATATLVRLVARTVPEDDRWETRRVAAALRTHGADPETSEAAAALYQRVRVHRFAPDASDERAVEPEARRVLERLPRRLLALLLSFGLMTGSGLAAQGAEDGYGRADPDSLYQAGRFHEAEQAFRTQLTAEPGSARIWFNLGASAWMTGRDADAAAAWLMARRLAPRSRPIAEAWQLVAPRSADLLWAGTGSGLLLTPTELAVLAGLGWVLAWWAVKRYRRRFAMLVGGITALALVGAIGLASWQARPVAVVSRLGTLRVAPHGLAEPVAQVDELLVVTVLDRRPGWRLVRTRRGATGWTPVAGVVEVGRLDSGR